jgi:hypothetical protein
MSGMRRLQMANVLARRGESRVVLLVRRVLITVACVHMVFFCWSIFRRLRQVLRIELRVSSPVLGPGSTVGYDVITSGEVRNRIRLELVQGARSAVLLEQLGKVNAVSAYDPRVFRYTPTVTITPELLTRFSPGVAALRLTAFGGQKLLHTPAPRVRELEVQLPGS